MCEDLCISCGSPFLPKITAFMTVNRLASMKFLQIESVVRRSPYLLERISRGNIPTLCNVKEKSHLIHKSHHKHALEFTLEHTDMNPTVPINKFPFITSPTAVLKNQKRYIARWRAPDPAVRLDYSSLWNYMLENPPPPLPINAIPPPEFSLELDLIVNACKDCNLIMTLDFWTRYHLSTSLEKNPSRLVPTGVISVFQANFKDHPDISESYQHWTAKRGQVGKKHPERNPTVRDRCDTAYLAYYLQMCMSPDFFQAIPANQANPGNAYITWTKQIYTKLSWIILEIACLCCEYKLGAQNLDPSKTRRTARCLLGCIELYTSFFGWTLACYQRPQLQGEIDFAKWHVWYVSDLEGSSSFHDNNRMTLLASAIIPSQCNIASRSLFQQVCSNLVQAYQTHMVIIRDMLTLYRTPALLSQLYPHPASLEHFLHPSAWPILTTRLSLVARNNLDSLILHIGIRAVWSRVLQLNVDMPVKIKQMMQEFLESWSRHELSNVKEKNKLGLPMALRIYRKCLMNPARPVIPRGKWACVEDLVKARALDYSNEV